MPKRLLVTVADLEPGAALDVAVSLADALDARRVPLTLLVGPRPHPEVAAWATARRRAGDATLLHGARGDGRHRTLDSRLPAHEAGLHLSAALRLRDALGLPVDGFAAPGWAVSDGVRRALAVAGVDVVVDAGGVQRLDRLGVSIDTARGEVTAPGAATRARRVRGWDPRPRRRTPIPEWPDPVGHVTVTLASPARPARDTVLASVDAALALGAVPALPAALVPSRAPRRRPDRPDPELWSITA